MVYAVENTNWKTLAKLAEKRLNILPIIEPSSPWRYRLLVGMVDVMIAAVDDNNEAINVEVHAQYYLKPNGHYIIYVKAGTDGEAVFSCLGRDKKEEFKPIEQITLEPFDGDHAYVLGVYRTPEVSPEIKTKRKRGAEHVTRPPQKSRRRHGQQDVSLIFEMTKTLPAYTLFEASSGFALFQTLGIQQFGDIFSYHDIEEYNNRFHENFELVAYYPFKSADEALVYHNDISEGLLPKQMINFLVSNLPKPRENGKHCYMLALHEPNIVHQVLRATHIGITVRQKHFEVHRGLHAHLHKIIQDIKPGDLEKAQLNLSRKHCEQVCKERERQFHQKKGKGKGKAKAKAI